MTPTIDALAASIAARVLPSGMVVVIAAGDSSHLVLDAAGRVIAERGGASEFRVVEPATTDRATWDAIDEVADRAVGGAGSLIVVHPIAVLDARLARVHAAASRSGGVLEITPDPARLGGPSGGWPDLVVIEARDGGLGYAVRARLSMVGDDSRRAIELLACGVAPSRLTVLLDPVTAERAADELAGRGLLYPGGAPSGVLAEVVAAATPARLGWVAERLLDGADRGELARAAAILIDRPARTGSIGRLFAAAAAAVATLVGVDPVGAAGEQESLRILRLADAAAECGVETDPELVGQAAVRAGDLARASALADQLGSDRRTLLGALRAIAAADFELAAVELAGSPRPALASWAAVAGGLPLGDPPSNVLDAATTVAAALDAWVASDSPGAFELLRLAIDRRGNDPLAGWWPFDPEELRVELALREGESAMAERLLGALPQPSARLRAAIAARFAARGRLDDAAELLSIDAARAADESGDATPPTDALLDWRTAATRCALARRDPDGATELGPALAAATGPRTPPAGWLDLDLLSEVLAVSHRIAPGSAEAGFDRLRAALERSSGDAAALRFDLAWGAFVVALAADDPTPVVTAARRLAELEIAGGRRAALQRAASSLAGEELRTEEVEHAATVLSEHGLPHEAARLCGIGALLARDEAVARRLLRSSRARRVERARLTHTLPRARDVERLSEQEVRVVRLVLGGHTHKQIGAELFISPKTVEHHVAHIKAKLRANNRAELLEAARSYLGSLASNPS